MASKSSHAEGRCYKLKPVANAGPPPAIDLSQHSYFPPVLDQGQLGSCASNAMANALAFTLGRERQQVIHPSRLALYYNCRVDVEHEPADEDTGVSITDMCKSVGLYEACPESDCPYDIANFSHQPPRKAYEDGELYKKVATAPVTQTLAHLQTELSQGFPVLCGIQVYDSFESEAVAESGAVPMPDTEKEKHLGGHAQLLVGYDDRRRAFKSCNSWGAGWGARGFSWIPYDFILSPDLASNFWVVRTFSR